MAAYSIAEAKAQLSALIDKVENGEAVTLTRRGVPIAKIVSINAEAPKQKIDVERIRRFAMTMPPMKESAVEAVRRMRAGRYGEVEE